MFAAGSAAAEDAYFDSAGVRLRYIEEGAGEPVVLIHGFGANADTGWTEPGIFKALAAHYHVVAMDLRGHGRRRGAADPRAGAAFRGPSGTPISSIT